MAMNAHISHKKSLMKEPNDSTLLQKRGKEREINCPLTRTSRGLRSSVDPRFVSPGSLDRSVPLGDRDLVRGISELAQDSFRMLAQHGRRHTV